MTDLERAEAQEVAAQTAFGLEQRILTNARAVSVTTWQMARDLHDFHEIGGWGLLGYDTLDEFLARPELGMSRSQFFRMTKAYRDLVVVKQVPVEKLNQIEPSKVHEIIPAVMRGQVSVDDALDDARELGKRDLRVKYHPDRADDADKAITGGKTALEAETIGAAPPADDEGLNDGSRVQCEFCNSWYTPDPDNVVETHQHSDVVVVEALSQDVKELVQDALNMPMRVGDQRRLSLDALQMARDALEKVLESTS